MENLVMKPAFAERLYAVLRSVDPSSATDKSDRLLARSAGRMLEEDVELALECGLPVEKIWQHVGDAIHNECLKAGRFPSEIKPGRRDRAALVAELADSALVHDYIRHIADISPEEIEAAATAKVAKMETARDAGTINVIDGLMYTKRAAHR
jgi:hypothetical protein